MTTNETGFPEVQSGFDATAIDDVYNRINFLTIKKSLRLLLDLNSEELDIFVQKYSIIIIYLLNILDPASSASILERINHNSILYLVEEEIRTILIRMFASVGEDPISIMDLSSFLDAVDRPEEFHHVIPGTGTVLKILQEDAARGSLAGARHFEYLEALSRSRKELVLKKLVKRNIHTALAVMMYASMFTRNMILDVTAFYSNRDLSVIPVRIFLERFQEGYHLYRSEKIRKHLPEEVGNLLEKRLNLSREKEELFQSLWSMGPGSREGGILDLVFHLVVGLDHDLTDLLLHELIRNDTITHLDSMLIQSMLKSRPVGAG